MKLQFVVLFVLLTFISSAFAQETGVQEVTGKVNADEPYFTVGLPDMIAGQTVYAYVESDKIDTILRIYDDSEKSVAENDDIADGNTNSALEFEIPKDGFYTLIISDCCNESAEGEFRLLVSLDNADVLTGEAEPTGAEFLFIPSEESESETDTEGSDYRDVCLPETDENWTPNIRLLFDAIGMDNEFEQAMLADIGFDSVEAMQEAADNGNINWFFFLPFLQDVTMVTFHICNGSTGYNPD